MSNKNVFDYKRKSKISRKDFGKALGGASRNFNNKMSGIESRAEYQERRARNAKKKQEYFKRKNASNRETPLEKVMGGFLLVLLLVIMSIWEKLSKK